MMLVIGISFIIIYPLIVKFSVSIMSRSDMNDVAVRWIAKNPTLDNFAFSFNAMVYPTAFANTLFTCVVCTLLQMFSCCLAAYSFVKLKFPGSKLLFILAVFTPGGAAPDLYDRHVCPDPVFQSLRPGGNAHRQGGPDQHLLADFYPVAVRGLVSATVCIFI